MILRTLYDLKDLVQTVGGYIPKNQFKNFKLNFTARGDKGLSVTASEITVEIDEDQKLLNFKAL